MPLKQVEIEVFQGVNLAKTSISGLKEPYCQITLGEQIFKTPSANGHGSNPKFHNSKVKFDYEKETRIRIEVYDRKGRLCGFYDHNLTEGKDIIGSNVRLCGPSGKAGELFMNLVHIVQAHPEPPKFQSVFVKVGSSKNLNNVEKLGKMDPYLKMDLGSLSLETTPLKDGGCNPNFDSEFQFPYSNIHYLTLSVFDASKFGPKLSGSGTLDLSTMKTSMKEMEMELKTVKGKSAGVVNIEIKFQTEKILKPLLNQIAKTEVKKNTNDTTSSHGNSKLTFSTPFHSLQCDILSISQIQKTGKLNPFVSTRLGDCWLSTKSIPKGGQNCDIGSRMIFPFSEEKNLLLKLMSRKKMGTDILIGSVKLDLEELVKSTGPHRVKVETKNKLGNPAGTIDLTIQPLIESRKGEVFDNINDLIVDEENDDIDSISTNEEDLNESVCTPALQRFKQLDVSVIRVKDLKDPQISGKMDPYVKCTLGQVCLESVVRKDAGSTAEMKVQFKLPFQGEEVCKLQFYDREHMMADRLIGESILNLETIASVSPNEIQEIPILGVKGKTKGQTAGTVFITTLFAIEQSISEAKSIDLNPSPPKKQSQPRKVDNAEDEDDEDDDDDQEEIEIQQKEQQESMKRIDSNFKSLEIYVSMINGCSLTGTSITNVLLKMKCGDVWLTSKKMEKPHEGVIELSQFFNFPYNGQTIVQFELYSKGKLFVNTLLAKGSMDIQKILLSNTSSAQGIHVSLDDPSGAPKDQIQLDVRFFELKKTASVRSLQIRHADDESSHGRTLVEEEVRDLKIKALNIHVMELRNIEGNTLAPYITLRNDGMQLKSEVKCGSNPKFNSTFSFPWNGTRRVKLMVYNKHKMHKDTFLCGAKVDLLNMMSVEGKQRVELSLRDSKGNNQGIAEIEIEFSPKFIQAATVLKDV